MFDEMVSAILAPLIVANNERRSVDEYVDEDETDSAIVRQKLDEYTKRYKPIISQLESYTRKSFEVLPANNGVRAEAKEPGIIELDYATLNKSEEELAFTLAHEWGHHDLGHLRNAHVTERMKIKRNEAEHSADFYAGIFMGYHNYDLKKLLEAKLRLPDGHTCHGSRVERAEIIARGFVLGKEMSQGNIGLGFVPGYEAYMRKTGRSPWRVEGNTAYSGAVLSKLRNESK